MLSMFKDKKGFSVLFNKSEAGGAAETAEQAARRSYHIGQQRCQRCWKSFAVPSGTLMEEYTCWRCDYPTCRHCREERNASVPWTCCTCSQPKSLMKLLSKTRYGTELVVHIMGYCDQRSERILKSFFRAAAMAYTTTRMLSNGRSSTQHSSRGENEENSVGKQSRLSGGLRVQSPNNANQIQSQKVAVTQRTVGDRRGSSKGVKQGSGTRSPKRRQRQQPEEQLTTPPKDSGVVYPDEDDLTASFCMPTIGTKDQDGVVEYSPCSKPYAQQQQQQQRQRAAFIEGASPLAFKGGDDGDDTVEAFAARDSARATHATPDESARPARHSAFEREEPLTVCAARTAVGACPSTPETFEASRSTAGQRMSRTDADRASFGCIGGPELRLGASPSPARSESPAPRFPTFAQFLDDQQALAAQQQLQLQGYGASRCYTSSGQSISVSPETDEEEGSHRTATQARTLSRHKTSRPDHATGRLSAPSYKRNTTGTAQGSLTPRPTTAKAASGQRSRRSSLEVSSAKKQVRRSSSGLLTPRGSLHAAGAASGRRTTRGGSGSRTRGSANYANPTILSTPPRVPLSGTGPATEQLSRTDASSYGISPLAVNMSGCAAAEDGCSSARHLTPRTPGRSSNGGAAFTRCATATRLSYGSVQERKACTTRTKQQRRPQSAILTRTGSSNAGAFRRQNSRGPGFGRTNSAANHLTRTASSHGYIRQPTAHSGMTTDAHGAHLATMTRTASAAASSFTRTASSNRLLSRGVAFHRGGGGDVSPLTRAASSGHPLLRQQTFTRSHTATQPFARTHSAVAGVFMGRSATTVPSRLVRTRSWHPTFGRSQTSTLSPGSRRSGNGPAPRTATATNGTSRTAAGGRSGAAASSSTTFGRRSTKTTVNTSSGYGRVGSTASPLHTRSTPHRRGSATASPLKRTNTATYRSHTPTTNGGAGGGRRPTMAATASERARLVSTPTLSRFERQPTRPRTTTPTTGTRSGTAGGTATTSKSIVEAAPMLVHMTRRRATGGAGTAPAVTPTPTSSCAQAAVRSTGTSRRLTTGSAATNRTSGATSADGTPNTRPLISSRNGTPRTTGRSGRSSVGGADTTSLKSSDSPRPHLQRPRTDLPGTGQASGAAAAQRRTTPTLTRTATPTGNVFQRLNTSNRRTAAVNPSPKEN